SINDRTRPSGGRRNALPDLIRTLREHETRWRIRFLWSNHTGTTNKLPSDHERHQFPRNITQDHVPGNQVILVTTVRVTLAIDVILKQIQRLGQPHILKGRLRLAG